MTQDFNRKVIQEWCPHAAPEDALITVFEKVRDIPYGSTGERNPENILKTNLGSCSGKHVLLSNLLKALGFQNRMLTCLHHFEKALPTGNDYPAALQEIIRENSVVDFHHYIKLKRGDIWVDLDVTWDLPLKAYGFPVNTDWDGFSDTAVAVLPISYYEETDDIIALKKKLIEELSPVDRKIRNRFMMELTNWLKTIRKGS